MITLHQEIYIAVIGHGDPPEFDDLVTAGEESVGRPIDINLEMLPSQVMSSLRTVP